MSNPLTPNYQSEGATDNLIPQQQQQQQKQYQNLQYIQPIQQQEQQPFIQPQQQQPNYSSTGNPAVVKGIFTICFGKKLHILKQYIH